MERPGEARTTALTRQTPHVFVWIARPRFHDGEGTSKVATQKFPNGKLRRSKSGEVTEGIHGGLEVVQAVEPDEVRQEEAREAPVDTRRQSSEDAQGPPIVRWQSFSQGLRHAPQALRQRQLIEIGECSVEKTFGRS